MACQRFMQYRRGQQELLLLHLMGGLKLRQVTGTLTAGDIEAINALLAR